MRARSKRPRRTKAVTVKFQETEFAALEHAAGKKDLGPFCREIVLAYMNIGVTSIERLQLRQQVATRELVQELMRMLALFDDSVEGKIREVRQKESNLVDRMLYRFKRQRERDFKRKQIDALFSECHQFDDEDFNDED